MSDRVKRDNVVSLRTAESVINHKTVAVYVGDKTLVGNAVYEEILGEDGKPVGAMVLVAIKDAYAMMPMVVPIDQNGQQGFGMTIMGYKLGTVVEVSEDASVVELSNDSPLYTEYVGLSTGVRVSRGSNLVIPQ